MGRRERPPGEGPHRLHRRRGQAGPQNPAARGTAGAKEENFHRCESSLPALSSPECPVKSRTVLTSDVRSAGRLGEPSRKPRIHIPRVQMCIRAFGKCSGCSENCSGCSENRSGCAGKRLGRAKSLLDAPKTVPEHPEGLFGGPGYTFRASKCVSVPPETVPDVPEIVPEHLEEFPKLPKSFRMLRKRFRTSRSRSGGSGSFSGPPGVVPEASGDVSGSPTPPAVGSEAGPGRFVRAIPPKSRAFPGARTLGYLPGRGGCSRDHCGRRSRPPGSSPFSSTS
jgi:hypothetical protein